MNGANPILEKRIGMRSAAPPPGGGHADVADFRGALAKAYSAAGLVQAQPAVSEPSKHLVKAGETLYGIANARLAAAGQPATPGASMRYALQIAKANQIRNPDLIYAGQQLDLAPASATINGRNEAVMAGARSTTLPDGSGIRSIHEVDWQARMLAANRQEDASEDDDYDAIHFPPPNPALPAAERIAADDDIRSDPDDVAAARVDLTLYQQTAPAGPPKPPGDLPDLVYKGMVGKALDMVPLEASTRTGLQQANAIISSSFAGRSLAALTGLGGPLLTIAGLVWGLFSAYKINAMQSDAPKQVAQNTAAEITH